MTPWLAALALLAGLSGMAAADPGQDLFTGQDPAAAGGRLARFPCHNCHGRDGRGGIEGQVPDIAGQALRTPTQVRPAYDGPGFGLAVRDGVGAGGRALSRSMPRYDLTEAELAALWDYLGDLPRRQAQGVTAGQMRIGVIVDPAQPEVGRRYLDRLRADMARALPSGTVYGRRVQIVALDDPRAQAAGVIAAVALPPGRADLARDLARLGLPVLFPLASLRGDEDPSILRAFAATDRDVHGAIAAHLARTPARRIAIVAGPERAAALARTIGLEMQGATVWRHGAADAPALDTAEAVVALDAELPGGLARDALVYLTGAQVAALAGADLGREGLDYARLPLAGTDHVSILALEAGP